MKNLVLISVILVFSFTCNAQKGKWKKVQKINTIESYQDFLRNYPDSEFSQEAELNLIDLEYEKAKKINTVSGYNYFLESYKNNNKHNEHARNSIIELEFKNAIKENTLKTYENFLRKYPENKYKKEILARIVHFPYANYNLAKLNLGSKQYENVKIINMIMLRVNDTKTEYKEAIPYINKEGPFSTKPGERIQNKVSKNAYSASYVAINGKDVSQISLNNISIRANSKATKLMIIDDNPNFDDQLAISKVASKLLEENNGLFGGINIGKEEKLKMGFAWIEQLENKDFELFRLAEKASLQSVEKLGILIISSIDNNNLEGKILGRLVLKDGEFSIKPSIQFLTTNGDIMEVFLDLE
jgi:hypothetical protein